MHKSALFLQWPVSKKRLFKNNEWNEKSTKMKRRACTNLTFLTNCIWNCIRKLVNQKEKWKKNSNQIPESPPNKNNKKKLRKHANMHRTWRKSFQMIVTMTEIQPFQKEIQRKKNWRKWKKVGLFIVWAKPTNVSVYVCVCYIHL